MITPILEGKLNKARVFSKGSKTFTLVTVARSTECSTCRNLIFPSRPAYRVYPSESKSGVIHPGCLGRTLEKA